MKPVPHPLNRLRWTPSHPLYEFDPLQVTPYRRVVGSYVETLAVSVIYTDGDAEMLTPDSPDTQAPPGSALHSLLLRSTGT